MKALFSSIIFVLFIFSCNTDKTTSDSTETTLQESVQNKSPLEGTWELIGYYNFKDNEVIDSFQTSEGYRQVKMYTPTKVMWSKYTPADSSEWFGYGSYRINGKELVEILEYGSQRMSEIIAEKKEFKHELMINGDMFSQIEIDEEGNKLYAENYKRIE